MNIRDIKLKIRAFLWKVLGGHDTSVEVKNLQEQVDTLHFFLNTLHDASSVSPTADEDLRILQLCDTQMLIIIDKLCKKHHLNYWLDYGTLLGAYRHKGFIPWDDDTDISMIRSDYNQVVEIVNSELGQYGIKAAEADGRIGIGYRHEETGIWVDIFAYDEYVSSNDYNEECKVFHATVRKYNDYLKNKGVMFSYSNLANILLKRHNTRTMSVPEHVFLYLCPRFMGLSGYFFRKDEIFPLSTLSFEGYTFSVPHDVTACLTKYYSQNFMSFPNTGVLHHGVGRTPLSTWAKTHEVDMNSVYRELCSLSDLIDSNL